MFWSQLPSGRWINLSHVIGVLKTGEAEVCVDWGHGKLSIFANADAHALISDLERLARRDQQSLSQTKEAR